MMANGMLAGLVAITAPCAFVAAVGGGGHRHHRRRHRRRGGVLHRAQARDRRPGRRHLGARRRRHLRRARASASSPTASTAPAGTAPTHRADGTGVTGILYGGDGCGPARRPGHRRASIICTVMFGIAFAFFKIQNALTKGGIRSDRGGRARGPRHARDGRARLPGRPVVTDDGELEPSNYTRDGTPISTSAWSGPAPKRTRAPAASFRSRTCGVRRVRT